MKKFVFFVLLTSFLLGIRCATAPRPVAISTYGDSLSPALEESLPFDPDVITDTLANGLVYYIRKNLKPERRAELRLAVNAGSVLESDAQQGLAHLCEHMAFNGTKNFARNDLVNYLESIGMRFGPEINAYTSFDETVYMLQVPTDSLEILSTAFQILEDWAANISFDSLEIEKERGVVIEEWRVGRGADARIQDQQLPVLLSGSVYANRLPIGKKEVLETFQPQSLRKFYRDWYRPDLMAVVAVGDFDPQQIQQFILRHFDHLSAPDGAPHRPAYRLPPHQETLFSIASDPEARSSSIAVYRKMGVQPEETVGSYRRQLVEMFYHQMFNQRLSELARGAQPPFLAASSGKGRLVRSSEVYVLNAQVNNNGIPIGLKALLLEAKRVREFGFTAAELERHKAAALRRMEQAYRERDKTESSRFAAEYIRHFLIQEPVPGIEYEYGLFRQLIPGIGLAEVNQLAREWTGDDNRVILASFPEKDGVEEVSEDQLAEILRAAEREAVDPYREDLPEAPLLAQLPVAGDIVSENQIEALNLTELVLSNGVRVILKPTDFQNDEVVFTAFSPGGYSLLPDSLLVAAKTAVPVIREGGLGIFSAEQLKKILVDKVVSVSPYIDEISEGISGSAAPADLETLFQLIYLWFTQPRQDSLAFLALRERFFSFYQNRSASPEAAFQDTITVTLTGNHPRYQPWTVADLRQMNPDKSLQIYRQRFADASDFTFIFVGNFESSQIKPLVTQYLGGLPALFRKEHWQDVTYDYPAGKRYKQVNRGIENKSQTSLFFLGDFNWSLQNRFIASALLEVLRIKLREQIRESLGGTYSVRVAGNFSRYPRERYQVTISFGSDPERTEELNQEIFSGIDSLKTYGIAGRYLDRVKEIMTREYETNSRENDYWRDILENRYFLGLDPLTILQLPAMIDQLSAQDIQLAASKYLGTDRLVQVVLLPAPQ